MEKLMRKRASFTTDRETWVEAMQLLKDKGYPQNAMGILLTEYIHRLVIQLEHTDGKSIKHLIDS